ncbi:MAG: hypothetical protein IJT84_07980 [Clostridia bacterium]|nr:hypothetical protein [Clostridia bacterium]
MKKFLALLCIICILLFPSTIVGAIGSSVTISTPNRNAYRGDIIELPINISANSQIQALGFTIFYDITRYEIISADKGGILSGSTVINTNTLGKIIFSYASTSPLVQSGTIITLRIRIKDSATFGINQMDLIVTEISDSSFKSIDYQCSIGNITIIAPKLDPPISLEIESVGRDFAELLWDDVEDSTGYNVYINGVKYNDTPVNDNICLLHDLEANTSYYVQISTLNYETESEKSEPIHFKTEKQNFLVVFVDWKYQGDYDWSDSFIDSFTVDENDGVVAPIPLERAGYTFVGWDTDFSNVTSDLIVQALYEENSCLHENTEIRNSSASTCTVHGYSGDTYCLDCGELVATGTELPLAAHHYVSTVTEPTPAAQGYTTHTCSVCGDSYIDTYTDYVGADAPQIVVSSGRAVLGNSINVTIALKNNPGIASAKLKVAYNSDVFALTNVTDGGILGTSVHKPQMASPYTLSWVNDTATVNFTANGTLATLTFAVDENAQTGNYPITVSYSYDDYDIYNVDVEPIRFAVVNGNIEVTDVIIGDVNGDGKVNNLDRVVLTRYLADWDDYPESAVDMIAADVNCDGKVNNLDRVILTRYLADWDDYTELPYTG